jgi:NAD+ diphosphatase
MSFEFTARLPLSRHAVDRDHVRRAGEDLFEGLRTDPGARVLPLWRGKALMSESARSEGPDGVDASAGPPVALRWLASDRLPAHLSSVYLGHSLAEDAPEPAGTPLVATLLTDEAASELETDESRWRGLRELATELSDRDAGAFAEALAMANWHDSHRHCPRCGAPTAVEDGGWTRRCPADGSQVFPRTDPAVIVLVTDADGRVLLGSNAMWEKKRYSLLAGFVEPGESLENAAIREVHEESGLRVTDAEYLGSQPWPFPASVMCGFSARLADDQDPGALLPDGEEILDLRWFTRDEIRAQEGEVVLPGRASIARALLEHWLGEPLEPRFPSQPVESRRDGV